MTATASVSRQRGSCSVLLVAIACTFTPYLTHTVRGDDDPVALTDRQKVVHVLNRLGFGARPGDVERVEAMGVAEYIRQQLHPESIDDARANRAIATLDTLAMSSSHLMDEYFDDIRRFLQEQMAAGNEADMKLRFGVDAARYGKSTTRPAAPAAPKAAPDPKELARRDALRCIGELQRAKLIRAVMSERQFNEVLVDFWSNHFNIDIRKNACRALLVAHDRDVIRPHVLGRFRELLGAVAHSPAMLAYLDNNENSMSRQRGKIETAIAEIYVGYKFGMNAKGMIPEMEGPNENYGREILELHTLGVDGGYTQQDVQEVARCFTGWTFNPMNGSFSFGSNRHDNGAKLVLGHAIAAGGGIKDGERVLDILAAHPSTASFIARKLCQRFVADEPSEALVSHVAVVFRESDGDIRRVVEAIVTSPEFFAPEAFRAKIKSPFEYAASAARATGAEMIDPPPPLWLKARGTIEGVGTLGYGGEKISAEDRKSLNWHVHDMGQPLFAYAAPSGYSERSAAWVSPGALVERLNFALALAGGKVSDLRVDPAKWHAEAAEKPEQIVDRLADQLLHGSLGVSSRRTLMKNAAGDQGNDRARSDSGGLVALVLGSPEFQRK